MHLKVDDYLELNLNILNMENCSYVVNISIITKAVKPMQLIVFDESFEIAVSNKTYCNRLAK